MITMIERKGWKMSGETFECENISTTFPADENSIKSKFVMIFDEIACAVSIDT